MHIRSKLIKEKKEQKRLTEIILKSLQNYQTLLNRSLLTKIVCTL